MGLQAYGSALTSVSFRRGSSRSSGTKQLLHPLSLYFLASAGEIWGLQAFWVLLS